MSTSCIGSKDGYRMRRWRTEISSFPIQTRHSNTFYEPGIPRLRSTMTASLPLRIFLLKHKLGLCRRREWQVVDSGGLFALGGDFFDAPQGITRRASSK